MDELTEQFAVEARELVQQASQDLLVLEGRASDRNALESLFRAVHTLKGSVGLFDFGPMHDVLHRAEDRLAAARSGDISVDTALIEPLINVIDWVDDSLDSIVATGHLSEDQIEQAARLGMRLGDETAGPGVPAHLAPPEPVPDWARALERDMRAAGHTDPLVAIRYEPHPECFFNGDDPLASLERLDAVRHLSFRPLAALSDIADYDPFRCNLLIEVVCADPIGSVEAVFRLVPDQVRIVSLPAPEPEAGAEADTGADRSARAPSVMRVDTARIDSLVEIAGELVAAKNGLAPLVDEARLSGQDSLARKLLASHHELERLVASLHGAVTKARMIALETTFRRFPRLVRETTAKLGKAIDLVIEGDDVEADREIVENLFEPLLHIVRNSLDHGIEAEEERLRQAKPARGRILIKARQRGDRIEIEVSDDGRGMQTARIARTAIERGLMTEAELAAMTPEAILQLVFRPGFSTAASVSDLSGRGVGLDVVQRALQRLGGTVGLKSVTGAGTSFVLNLPVSFSMMQMMVVEAAGERYGIPMTDILETCRLHAQAVQPLRAGLAFILRDRTVPLVSLRTLLNLPPAPLEGELKVLVVQSGGDRIGIIVDTISERTETLTRPLSGLLHGVPGIAGTTMLGDGQVLLVLNLEDLAR